MNATYGTLQNFIPVTDIVAREFIVENCLKIAKSVDFNDYFGDVAPNELKQLIIYDRGTTMVFPESRYADYEVNLNVERQKTHFVTYGNEKFVKSLTRICKEARESGFFDGSIFGYSKLDKEFTDRFKSILERSRGGGYWIWKPYLIQKALESIAEDDILVYCDAGCTINKQGKSKLENIYKKIVNESKYGIIGFDLVIHKEAEWTNEKLFEYFGISKSDERNRQSSQLMASIIIMRKCQHSKLLVKEWLDALYFDPELFTDTYNEYQVSPQFNDHRHDQSVFSILRKLRGCEIINDDTYARYDWSTLADTPFQTTRIRE